jgi:BMFP domain-containing protein YqiC
MSDDAMLYITFDKDFYTKFSEMAEKLLSNLDQSLRENFNSANSGSNLRQTWYDLLLKPA